MPTKTEYIIEILKTGDGAKQAVADFKAVGAAATTANATIATGAVTSSMSVKEGSKQIRNALHLIGITAFPQATYGAMVFKGAMEGVRGAMAVAGVGLVSGAASIVLVGTAAVTAVAGIRALDAHIQQLGLDIENIGSNNRLWTTLIDQVGKLEQAGKITAEVAKKIREELFQSTKSVADPAANFAALDKISKKLIDLPLAHEHLAEVATQANQETLSGLARQLQAIEDVYKARLKQIELEEKKTGANLQPEADIILAAGKAQQGAVVQALQERLLLTGTLNEEARKGIAISLEYQHIEAEIAQIKEKHLMTDEQIAALESATAKAHKVALIEVSAGYKIALEAAQQFAAGFSSFVVNSIRQGRFEFKAFVSEFLAGIAQMIIQQIIFNALKGAFGLGKGAAAGGTFFDAAGGVHFAANGIMTVSRPTLLPRFDVVAGEVPGSPEMLTVLSRPRMMEIGGIQAAVGNAAGHRLAITSAADLERGPAGAGRSEIVIRLSAGLEASIVQNSIQGARILVVRDLSEDSDASKAVKRLVS